MGLTVEFHPIPYKNTREKKPDHLFNFYYDDEGKSRVSFSGDNDARYQELADAGHITHMTQTKDNRNKFKNKE